MEDTIFTPSMLNKSMVGKAEVLNCEIATHVDQAGEIDVYIKLKFWHRLRAVLFSDYGNHLVQLWSIELLERIPMGVALRVKLVL